MASSTFLLLLCITQASQAAILHEFVRVDYQFPNNTIRQDYITSGKFNARALQISGVAVDATRSKEDPVIYVTVNKIKYTDGVPAGLATIHKNWTRPGGPWKSYLVPYPSWEENEQGNCNALQFPMSTAFDPHNGYLWVLDVGRTGVFSQQPLNLCPAKLVAYDTWHGGRRVVRYEFPPNVVSPTTNFINDLTLDYVDPDDHTVKYVYISDTLDFKVVVYDVRRRISWSFKDPSMVVANPNITLHGVTYNMPVGINGICLGASFNYLYYSQIADTRLFQVPTWVLRDKGAKFGSYVRSLGNKVSNSDGIFCGRDGILYGALEEDAIYRWDMASDMAKQQEPEGRVKLRTEKQLAQNWETMQWVDGITIDQFSRIYFTTGKAQLYHSGTLDFSGISGPNFRLFRIQGNDRSYLGVYVPPLGVIG